MNRIKELRKKKRMNQSELARAMNVQQNTVSTWETAKVNIDFSTVKRLAEFFDVSPAYLMGEDTDFNPEGKHVRIRVLGSVAAGIPIEAIEDVVDWEEIPESMSKTGIFFGLRVKGQSMEPRFLDGDTVIVRKQASVESGEIGIVLVNGDEATMKKVVRHERGGLSLVAFNTAVYEPRFFTPKEIEELPVQIIGKVVELRGKF